MAIKSNRCRVQSEKQETFQLRKKYSTRDVELRMRSKKKCCTEII